MTFGTTLVLIVSVQVLVSKCILLHLIFLSESYGLKNYMFTFLLNPYPANVENVMNSYQS